MQAEQAAALMQALQASSFDPVATAEIQLLRQEMQGMQGGGFARAAVGAGGGGTGAEASTRASMVFSPAGGEGGMAGAEGGAGEMMAGAMGDAAGTLVAKAPCTGSLWPHSRVA